MLDLISMIRAHQSLSIGSGKLSELHLYADVVFFVGNSSVVWHLTNQPP